MGLKFFFSTNLCSVQLWAQKNYEYAREIGFHRAKNSGLALATGFHRDSRWTPI